MGFFDFLKGNTNIAAPIPNNFDAYSIPTQYADCQEIIASCHEDRRILTNYLCASRTELERDDKKIGGSKRLTDIMCNLGWLEELNHEEILREIYSTDELREFLQSHDLKVSGSKAVIIDRLLEVVPFEKLNRRYKSKLFKITSAGTSQVEIRKADFSKSVIDAINAVRNNDFTGALTSFNLYDAKWGFSRDNERPYSIFSKSVIPSKRFSYVLKYPMNELKNSDDFKRDLRATLFVALMRGKQRGIDISSYFRQINTDPINCPSIVSFCTKDRTDMDASSLSRTVGAMNECIKNNPDSVLEYYISKILYKIIPQY